MEIKVPLRLVALALALTPPAPAAPQGEEVRLPFFGTFGAGSPELATYGLRPGDIVRRKASTGAVNTPSIRATVPDLHFIGVGSGPGQIPYEAVEINSFSGANDVYSLWGPWSNLPDEADGRDSTISFTVTPKSTVGIGGPAPMCDGAPVSAQIFRVNAKTAGASGGQNFFPQPPIADDCGLGVETNGEPTRLTSLATEARDGPGNGLPGFFTLTRTSCAALAAAGYDTHPAVVWFADGVSPPIAVLDAVVTCGLSEGDAIDALAISNSGCIVFSLDAESPTVVAGKLPCCPPGCEACPQRKVVGALYSNLDENPDELVAREVVVDQNTLIGFVPSIAADWDDSIVVPFLGQQDLPIANPYGFDKLFLWFDPTLLGLDGVGEPGYGDDLNGLQLYDPPSVDGMGGSIPLRGGPGDGPRQRLSLFARGLAGNGGGVVPVPAYAGETIKIELAMNGTKQIDGAPAFVQHWSLWCHYGIASENTYQSVGAGGSLPPWHMFFNPFDSGSVPLIGTTSNLPYALGPPLAPGTTFHSFFHPLGMFEGSIVLQAIAVTNLGPVWTSNCVQIDVRPPGSHVPLH